MFKFVLKNSLGFDLERLAQNTFLMLEYRLRNTPNIDVTYTIPLYISQKLLIESGKKVFDKH